MRRQSPAYPALSWARRTMEEPSSIETCDPVMSFTLPCRAASNALTMPYTPLRSVMAIPGSPSRTAVSTSSSGWLAPSRKEKLVLHQSGTYMSLPGSVDSALHPGSVRQHVDKQPEYSRRGTAEVVVAEKRSIIFLRAPPGTGHNERIRRVTRLLEARCLNRGKEDSSDRGGVLSCGIHCRRRLLAWRGQDRPRERHPPERAFWKVRVHELRGAHGVVPKARPDCGKRKGACLQVTGPHGEKFLLPAGRDGTVGAELDILHSGRELPARQPKQDETSEEIDLERGNGGTDEIRADLSILRAQDEREAGNHGHFLLHAPCLDCEKLVYVRHEQVEIHERGIQVPSAGHLLLHGERLDGQRVIGEHGPAEQCRFLSETPHGLSFRERYELLHGTDLELPEGAPCSVGKREDIDG